MKRIISILLTAVLLVSLAAGAFAEEAPQAPDFGSGTPWADIDLDGVVTADTPTNLKDDFALAVNKEAILSLEIPEGYPYGGTVMDVALQQADDVKNMFLGDEPSSHDAKLAYDLFGLMMDWDSRNAQGVAPLKAQTDLVEEISSIDELTAYFKEVPVEEQLFVLWGCGSTADLVDSSRYVLAVSTGALFLGDSAEYSALTDYGAIKKADFTEFAGKMLGKLGYSDEEAARKIENCFTFEDMIAPAIMTNEEKRSPDYISRVNNHYTREELLAAQDKLPVLEMLESTGFPEADDYLVMEPDYLVRLNEVYTEENLTLMKDYMLVHGAVSMAGYLDRECYEWSEECSNAISGATGMLDDETSFSAAVSGTLAWPVAQLYTETYLKQEDKDRISAMVDEILAEYHGILSDADFLSEETRANAIEKLETIDKRILFPDSWEKYSCGELNFASAAEGGTLWQAILNISSFFLDKSIREYSEPVDKEEWAATPHTVNCFYTAQSNSIYILGAFAQGSIYNSDMTDEELYAKLGTVIGHEISHAFDSSGAQFDKDGNLVNWWTDEDYAAFLGRNEKMVAYYNAMHPWEGQDFYGSIMTGEACADMAGMKCMLRIASEKEDFDYDSFFRAYADLWLTKDTLQMSYARINDNHPMGYLRVNATLQQFDEFLNFYGISEGDGMYLAPEDRVCIW